MADSSFSRDARAGFADIAPALVAAIPISLLFGALAAGKGLSVVEIGLMSLLVFAGGAQFAALELWATPAPVLALVFSTLLINARHILMSASLVPKAGAMTTAQKLVAFWSLADENWAMAERRAAAGRPVNAAWWWGAAGPFVANWVMMSCIGAAIGTALGDPRSIGADFAFTCIFIALVAAFWRGRITAVTVAASGLASAGAYVTLGPPWHVAAGALAGIAAAALAWREEDEPARYRGEDAEATS